MKQDEAIWKAREMIRNGEAECVIVRDGSIVLAEHGHGVSPLLNVYEQHAAEMNGAVLVDKVIGRAAGFIAIAGGVKHIYGEIMSEEAVALLKENGITTSQNLLVPRILNRKRTDLCPLEQSVLNCTTPEQAIPAMKQRIAEMQQVKK